MSERARVRHIRANAIMTFLNLLVIFNEPFQINLAAALFCTIVICFLSFMTGEK